MVGGAWANESQVVLELIDIIDELSGCLQILENQRLVKQIDAGYNLEANNEEPIELAIQTEVNNGVNKCWSMEEGLHDLVNVDCFGKVGLLNFGCELDQIGEKESN